LRRKVAGERKFSKRRGTVGGGGKGEEEEVKEKGVFKGNAVNDGV
jgi:hypothetical protein